MAMIKKYTVAVVCQGLEMSSTTYYEDSETGETMKVKDKSYYHSNPVFLSYLAHVKNRKKAQKAL